MITAVDVETALIAPGVLAPPLTCVAWSRGLEGDVLDHVDGCAFMHDLLDSDSLIVNLNIAFDFVVLAREDFSLLPKIFKAYDRGQIRDIGIRQKLIDLADGTMKFAQSEDGEVFMKRSYSLAALVDRYTGRKMVGKDDPNAWRLRYGTLRGVPIESWEPEARKYPLVDANEAFGLYLAQNNALMKSKSEMISERPTNRWAHIAGEMKPSEEVLNATIINEIEQAQAAFSLQLMSTWGLRTDPRRVEEFRRELIAQADKARPDLIRNKLIRENNTKDANALRERVEIAYKDRDIDRTPTGKVKASKDVLKTSGDPLLIQYVKYIEAEKQLSTYVPTLLDGVHRPITPSYSTLVETGRTSSFSPNIQNFSRGGGARRCFTPRPGFVFVDADYSLLELRTLGQVMLDLLGHSTIADALQNDLDVHLMVGAQLGDMTYEQALAKYKAGDEVVKELRQISKIGNYGYPGGMSPPTFVKYCAGQDIFITLDKSRELHRTFFDTWPDVKDYFNWIKAELGPPGEGQITQVRSGRRRYVTRFTQAANGFFQSLAADGAKEACYRVSKECYVDKKSALYGSRPVAMVHDEILVETVESRAPEAAERLAKVMIEAMARYVPDVPILAEPTVSRYWMKGVKSIRDANGRLMIWEPKAA